MPNSFAAYLVVLDQDFPESQSQELEKGLKAAPQNLHDPSVVHMVCKAELVACIHRAWLELRTSHYQCHCHSLVVRALPALGPK
jgi:hypothetical protein